MTREHLYWCRGLLRHICMKWHGLESSNAASFWQTTGNSCRLALVIRMLRHRERLSIRMVGRMTANGSKNASSALEPQSLPPEELIFGSSAAMQQIRQKVDKVCRTNLTILIEGEGGSGKEVLARWVHLHSPWGSGPFVRVNCAAVPGTLLESELFGYQAGAFTGAYTSKPGRVELARNGTLFLSEISEFGLGLQAKLLQFLQDGHFTRIGDHEERYAEARVICATNRNLEQDVDAGTFRRDLFYRINTIRIRMPRLAERREDIIPLSEYFRCQFNARFQRVTPAPAREFCQLLETREWRGNIRELENRVARYVILGANDDIDDGSSERRTRSTSLPLAADGTLPFKRLAKEAARQMERKLILRALEANHWNRRRTAEVLKISYRALINKIREAGLARKNGRRGNGMPTQSGSDLIGKGSLPGD